MWLVTQKHVCGKHSQYNRELTLPSLVSRDIVLMRTNVINLLNRVPKHDSLDFFCGTQNKM